MGAKSTMDLTRTEALILIIALLQKASNEALASALEDLNDDAGCRGDFDDYIGLNNFCVT